MRRSLRDLVWRRADRRCEYCRIPQQFDPATFEIDHVVARKHRGATAAENLALSCWACNCGKGSDIASLDPETGLLCPLFNPRADRWSEHFRWEGPVLVGTTAIGRATVAVLNINATTRVEHRECLRDAGEWPPTD